jgi:hypothetical protein
MPSGGTGDPRSIEVRVEGTDQGDDRDGREADAGIPQVVEEAGIVIHLRVRSQSLHQLAEWFH